MDNTSSFPPARLAALTKQVFTTLKQRREKICIVETACGGLLSSTFLSIPGASAIFAGGQVLYTLPSRIAYADWTPTDLAEYAGPTPEMVERLCASMRQRLSTDPLPESNTVESSGASTGNVEASLGSARDDKPVENVKPAQWLGGKAPSSRARIEDIERLWALGESGTAGPGRSGEGRNRTPGYVALAVVGPGGVRMSTDVETGKADRVGNMVDFAEEALHLLIRAIDGAPQVEKL